jgi:hypothetical protein
MHCERVVHVSLNALLPALQGLLRMQALLQQHRASNIPCANDEVYSKEIL